jgi:hypothetical protein
MYRRQKDVRGVRIHLILVFADVDTMRYARGAVIILSLGVHLEPKSGFKFGQHDEGIVIDFDHVVWAYPWSGRKMGVLSLSIERVMGGEWRCW